VIYRFDAYSLDTESLELRENDVVVSVEPQVFSVLAYLIENRDKVVSKDELIDAVWDGRAISDGALNSRINSVRRAVGDDGTAQAVIKTFARRGFRFVGNVIEDGSSNGEVGSFDAQFDKPSIAVLPFGNLSNDPEQEYFSDGITEDLITALSRIRRFRAVARGSTFSYKGHSSDLRQIAQELDARYVIEGSVRKSGNRIRLTAQLVDGGLGKDIWAERYDRELEDIFALQDELTLAIVGAVEPAMGQAEQDRAKRKPPENLDAWESYQQGMSFYYKRTEEGFWAARRLFQHAISIDPQFALAYAGLARNYYYNVLFGTMEGDAEEAEKAALKAIELDPDEAEAHLALGNVYSANREFDRAIPEFETAISLNPGYASAYHRLATAVIHIGRAEEALPHLLTAIRLSPKDGEIALFHARLALAHLFLRQHAEAVEWARKAIRLPGIQWPGHCFLVASLAHLDEMAEAQIALERLLLFRPGITASFVQDHFPTSIGENLDHLVDGLRKAGLPE
jgi:TolB-like protein/Flp pilus assembly protein TadD